MGDGFANRGLEFAVECPTVSALFRPEHLEMPLTGL